MSVKYPDYSNKWRQTSDDKKSISEKKTCPDCLGDGEQINPFAIALGIPLLEKCERCKGTGKIA